MKYLVDSHWIIDNLLGVREAVDLLDALSADGIAVSIITYMEVYEGTLRAQATEELRDAFTRFFATADILAFTPAVARRCAILRQELRRQGKRVNARALDLCIAATALAHNLEFVTENKADYDDIPGLSLYQQ